MRTISVVTNRRRACQWVAGIVCLGLVSFAFASWFVAGALLAPAIKAVGDAPSDFPATNVTFDSESGATIAAWYAAAETPAATVVLVHGIHGNRSVMLQRGRMLRNTGYSVLLIDLQAHGESTGSQVTLGKLEQHDVRAAVAYCRRMRPDDKIGVIGVSLGGASTVLASPLDVDAIVLESVFSTISDAVYNRVSVRVGPLCHLLAPALLCQLQPRLGVSPSDLRPIDHLADMNCPVLVASGEVDQHTTVDETRRLFEAAREPKKLVIFNGAAHIDLCNHDPRKYQDEVLSFLDACLKPDSIRAPTASEVLNP